jgi:hypothetical protein
MAETPRSNRPAPRTPAAVEAELRRRIRAELTQARAESETGELDDAALAEIIARAVAAGLGFHLEAPEHTRNATLSSRSWRPAAGPRGGPRQQQFEDEREPRRGFQPREFERGPRERDSERGPRDFERGPREFERGPRDFERGPREFERGPRDFERGPRDRDLERGPRRPPSRGFDQGGRPPARGGGFKRGGGGGFSARRPPRSR